MNPIYRHSFVNAFLANGAISNTTGNINGNNTNFYYTRTFVPVGNVYPANCFRITPRKPGGAFTIAIKRLSAVGEATRPPQIRNLTYQAMPHISGLM